ncbi:MAG: hypothetical protein UHS49_00015, partial [Faecalimonas sp.]|nr:hypothetical protein [Faecalimonas sp.]
MKKTKKLSALLLILVMLVNLLPSAVAGTVAEASATEAVRYVSATGDDSANDGTTAEAPYKTLKAAITALNSVDATDKIVKIVGNYTWNRDDTVAHSKMITLAGNEGTEVLSLSGQNVWHQSGALKIENLVLNYTVSEGGIYSFGNEMVIGENVTVAYNGDTTASLSSFYPRLGAGAISSHTCSQSSPHKLTLNSGRFSDVFLGDTAFTSGTTHTTPGIEFTMNPGATAVTVKIGGNGAAACNSYTDNVNLVLNGGTITSSVCLAGTDTSKLNFNGNAVQVILNNGFAPTLNDNLTADNIAACGGGVYYRLNCAAAVDGSILETTGTAGTYKVNGDMTATATDAN